jgi:hypothetical protein
MKDVEDTEVTHIDTCIKCDKSMISKQGKRLGGVMSSVFLDNSVISGLTCWECVFSKES